MQRLEAARKSDLTLLGELSIVPCDDPSLEPSPKCYLPNDVSKIFSKRLFPPRLQDVTHPLQLSTILSIASDTPPTPKPSPFLHGIDDKSVMSNSIHNSQLIAGFDHEMQQVLDSHPGSVISPGSEFRTAEILRPLLSGHPYWSRFEHNIIHGVSYPLTAEEYEPARLAENEAILAYGNHASGKKHPEALSKVLCKDAAKGFSLPITFDCARTIKHSRISPMGVAHQLGIDANGTSSPNCVSPMTNPSPWAFALPPTTSLTKTG